MPYFLSHFILYPNFLLISSPIIIIGNDCGVFTIVGIHCQITNREVDYHQQDMDYMREKIAISIMKHKIELEVKMDSDNIFQQLVPRTKPKDEISPDDESINTIFA